VNQKKSRGMTSYCFDSFQIRTMGFEERKRKGTRTKESAREEGKHNLTSISNGEKRQNSKKNTRLLLNDIRIAYGQSDNGGRVMLVKLWP